MSTQPEALRLAKNLTAPWALRTATAVDAAAELLRLHDENETLRQQRDEIFTAMTAISLRTHLGGEVAEYGDVVDAVRRLKEENERLHQINQSHEMKLSVRGYEIQIEDLRLAHAELREKNVELLEALERLVVERKAGLASLAAWDQARAAIARAEGEKG